MNHLKGLFTDLAWGFIERSLAQESVFSKRFSFSFKKIFFILMDTRGQFKGIMIGPSTPLMLLVDHF